MDQISSRLLVLVGTVVYLALTALSLLTYVTNVAMFSWVTLGIAVQVLLGVPFILHLFLGAKFPAGDYARWLALLVSVLAVSGYLGVPRGTYEQRILRFASQAEEADIADDMGALEVLELKVKLAKADSDGDKEELRKKIENVTKELSEADKKKLEQKKDVLEAEGKIEEFKAPGRAVALHGAEGRAGLIVIAAFLILAGCWMTDRQGGAPR